MPPAWSCDTREVILMRIDKLAMTSREALQTDEPNPKIEEALKLLERMAQ